MAAAGLRRVTGCALPGPSAIPRAPRYLFLITVPHRSHGLRWDVGDLTILPGVRRRRCTRGDAVPGSDPAIPGPFGSAGASAAGTRGDDGRGAAGRARDGRRTRRGPRLAGAAGGCLTASTRPVCGMLRDPYVAPAAPAVLDVGAGRGRFVAAARRARATTRPGIEPSARVEAATRSATFLPARGSGGRRGRAGVGRRGHASGTCSSTSTTRPPRSSAIAGWLRPGGVVLVGVPEPRLVQARVGGARWYHLDVPRHRSTSRPRGLDALLRGAGLTSLRTHHV